MSNIFQKLELAAFRNQITPRTKESREWFMNKARPCVVLTVKT